MARLDDRRENLSEVERIEQGLLEEQNQERLAAVSRSLRQQNIDFEAGVHARWLFHGTDSLDKIIRDPLNAFSMALAGSSTGQIWGTGIYLARDAVYSNDYTKQRNPDGSKRMLLCLVATGNICAAGPELRILPDRRGFFKYDSSVDSLSNPEIHVVNNAAHVTPAYVITYAPAL